MNIVKLDFFNKMKKQILCRLTQLAYLIIIFKKVFTQETILSFILQVSIKLTIKPTT